MMLIVLLAILALILLTGYCDKYIKHSKWWGLLLVTVMGIVIGIRKDVGIDYEMYEKLYENPSWREDSVEVFWILFINWLNALGFRARMFFFVCALATMYLVYVGYRKSTVYFYFTIFFFVVTGIYFETGNTVRQCLAMSSIVASFPYLNEKRYKVAIPLMVLACLFHNSGIIGIGLLFISRIKFNQWILAVILLISLIYGEDIMKMVLGMVPQLTGTLGLNTYDTKEIDTGITSGALKFVYAFIGLLLLVSMKALTRIKPEMRTAVTMVIAAFSIYCIFYTFQPARRLYIYGLAFLPLVLPYYWKSIPSRALANILLGLMTIGLLAFLVKSNLLVTYDYDFIFLK